MTRCEDCLHFELCDALERCNGVSKISSYDCGYYENTTSIQKAKQEVAREIFEEIETSLHIESFHGGEVYYSIRAEDYLHYKKKYTESEGEYGRDSNIQPSS